MKYLAVFLAVLSAGRAYGGEPIRFVPEQLTMTISYLPTGGGAEQKIKKTFNGAEPRVAWMSITDKPYPDRKPTIVPDFGVGRIEPTSVAWTYDKINGNTGVRAFLNENYSVATYLDPAFGGTQTSLPLYISDRSSNYIPTSDDPYQQQVQAFCGVPENIMNDDGYPYFSTGVRLAFTQDTPGLVRSPVVHVGCLWQLRPIYDLSLTLEKETMLIEDKSGSTKVYDNSITVTGNGGPATIHIANPSSTDVSVSFSVSEADVLTYTARPTPGGTAVPFYVLVKNTKAGSRTYSVNFTASYN